MKNWTKRRIVYYGEQSVQIEISVFGYDTLMPKELKQLGDHLADEAMKSIHDAPFLDAPLSRMKIERPR
jgi:hypothetical protein